MTTVTSLIYQAAGGTKIPGSVRGLCRSCGEAGIGQPFDVWVKDTFNDHDKLCPGEIICRACLFCFDDHNEELRRRTGKPKLQRMRNYSHFVVAGEWYPLSKGDKRGMRELLGALPEVAVVALSGQKHLLFRARPGWWQIEEHCLCPDPALLERLMTPMETLYRAGASKAEIESGRYAQASLLRIGIPLYREMEPQLKRWRGAAMFSLAVFLAQKDDDHADDTGADS